MGDVEWMVNLDPNLSAAFEAFGCAYPIPMGCCDFDVRIFFAQMVQAVTAQSKRAWARSAARATQLQVSVRVHQHALYPRLEEQITREGSEGFSCSLCPKI